MAKFNFIKDFQKDHMKLFSYIASFRKAVERSDRDKAKEILTKINQIADGHFSFEETYLYPRLRRRINEITQQLLEEQGIFRDFLDKSKIFLNGNKINKNKLSFLLDLIPRLSKLLVECNGLTVLIDKFDEVDKDDLEKRFKEFCRKS